MLVAVFTTPNVFIMRGTCVVPAWYLRGIGTCVVLVWYVRIMYLEVIREDAGSSVHDS